jgi:hypothetical protein
VEIPDAELEPKRFSFDEINSLDEARGQLVGIAEWIGDKIQEAKEFKALVDRNAGVVAPETREAVAPPISDDDIPF